MEEVIKEKTTVGKLFLVNKDEKIKEQRQRCPCSLILTLCSENNGTKKHTYRAKGGIVEESKKGYTGDALALRGDEGRDKLR